VPPFKPTSPALSRWHRRASSWKAPNCPPQKSLFNTDLASPTAKEANRRLNHSDRHRRHQPANNLNNFNLAAKNNLKTTARKMRVTISNQSTSDHLDSKICHDRCLNDNSHCHQHLSAAKKISDNSKIKSSTDKPRRHQHHSAAKKNDSNGSHRKIHLNTETSASDKRSATKLSHQVAVMPSKEVHHQAAKPRKFRRQ